MLPIRLPARYLLETLGLLLQTLGLMLLKTLGLMRQYAKVQESLTKLPLLRVVGGI